jgi:glycerophosphoryl diester phosphodiesterase
MKKQNKKEKQAKPKKIKKQRTKKQKALIAVCAVLSAVILFTVCFAVGEKIKYPKIKAKQTVNLSSMLSDTSDIRLIAHRGLSGVAPENTLPAFNEAGEAKYYGAECDVHLTSDRKWVIMHDSNTRRMCGVRKEIARCTFNRLNELNITNGANIDNYYTVKIPTLESYLDVCFEYSLTPVIEVKLSDCSFDNMQYLYDTVQASDIGSEAIFISFYREALENLRKVDENVPCLLLVREMTREDIDYCASKGFGIDFDANNKNLADETVKYAVDSGIVTACWTVDTKETLVRMHTLGVRIFTTNCILPEV